MKKLLLNAALILLPSVSLACPTNEEWLSQNNSEFRKIDRNRDEKLDYSEFKETLKDTGAPSYAIKQSWERFSGGKEYISKDVYILSKKPRCAGEAIEETEIKVTE